MPIDKTSNQKGFTLIELSIVLIIIGLIVGGILVGQNLIESAKNKAAVQQLTNIETSVNTFIDKYNAKPGDISAAVAYLGAGATPGDGNGVIEGSTGAPGELDGEVANFWDHMSLAEMTDSTYTPYSTSVTVGVNAPESKMGTGNIILPYFLSSINSHVYLVMGSGSGVSLSTIANDTGLSPSQAETLDRKLDDGNPVQGSVRPFNTDTTLETPLSSGTALTNCVDAAGNYMLSNDGPNCNLRIRASAL